MANEQNLKPFVKNDPRINRSGRPKSFDALRKLAQKIAHEKVTNKKGEAATNPAGQAMTVVEVILRKKAMSNNPKELQEFIEIAFGKVPNVQQLEGKDGNAIIFKVERE